MSSFAATSWVRVTRSNPCPICGKHDWCGIASDGSASCCMRVESQKSANNGGWIHRMTDPAPPRVILSRPKATVELDAESVMTKFQSAITEEQIAEHTAELGVSPRSMEHLCVGYSLTHKAFAWPMRNPAGTIVGIRLRDRNAQKWAVKGSHAGLFYDPCLEPSNRDRVLYVTEGPTDTAAALTLGLPAAGRHSCTGQTSEVIALARRLGFRRIVVISDSDEPGQAGAQRLVEGWPDMPWKIITPNAKDLRAWVAAGATRELIACIERQQLWRMNEAGQYA